MFIQDTDKTYTLNNVPVNITIEDLGKRLNEEKGLDPDYLRLIFNGKQMKKGGFIKCGSRWVVLTSGYRVKAHRS